MSTPFISDIYLSAGFQTISNLFSTNEIRHMIAPQEKLINLLPITGEKTVRLNPARETAIETLSNRGIQGIESKFYAFKLY